MSTTTNSPSLMAFGPFFEYKGKRYHFKDRVSCLVKPTKLPMSGFKYFLSIPIWVKALRDSMSQAPPLWTRSFSISKPLHLL